MLRYLENLGTLINISAFLAESCVFLRWEAYDTLIAKITLSVNRQNILRKNQNKILNITDRLKITYFCFKNEPILARVKTIDQNEVECSNP